LKKTLKGSLSGTKQFGLNLPPSLSPQGVLCVSPVLPEIMPSLFHFWVILVGFGFSEKPVFLGAMLGRLLVHGVQTMYFLIKKLENYKLWLDFSIHFKVTIVWSP